MFSADNLKLRERQKNIEAAHEIVCKGGSVTADKKKKNGKGKSICGDGKKVDKIRCTLGRDEAQEHFFRHTAINSPHCQEFMV